MIEFLKNHEIDREQWDSCINASKRTKPYALSWYLDIMSPGWEALVDDDYDSVFPIPSKTKFGIRYIATPAFLQQLGAFSPDKNETDAINEFIDYMPETYKLIDLCIGQQLNCEGFRCENRSNYVLDLSEPYEKLWENFNVHCRRNIESSVKKRPEIVYDASPDELINLFLQNRARDIKGIKQSDYQKVKNLMDFCLKNKKGRIIGVRGSRQRLIYGTFIVEIHGCKTMLFVVNSPDSRTKRTGYFVLNELIRQNSSTKTVIDFAGSSIPSIASFMESFGSKKQQFFRIYSNRLPWPLRWFK
jgi:hypothetical protein